MAEIAKPFYYGRTKENDDEGDEEEEEHGEADDSVAAPSDLKDENEPADSEKNQKKGRNTNQDLLSPKRKRENGGESKSKRGTDTAHSLTDFVKIARQTLFAVS